MELDPTSVRREGSAGPAAKQGDREANQSQDHHGAEGNDNKALHRALKKDAIRTAEAAGFVLEGESGLLHMHGDDMTQSVFTEGLRGKTHRFLLKLRKPEG